MMEETVMTCSECSTSPWDRHCCTCEPCVVKREKRNYNAGLEAAAKFIEEWEPRNIFHYAIARGIRGLKK